MSGETLVPLSYDENLALSRVEMINNNVEVISDPEPGEDPQTHIDIYSKCLDTKARKSILDKYNAVLIKKKELAPMMEQGTDGQ